MVDNVEHGVTERGVSMQDEIDCTTSPQDMGQSIVVREKHEDVGGWLNTRGCRATPKTIGTNGHKTVTFAWQSSSRLGPAVETKGGLSSHPTESMPMPMSTGKDRALGTQVLVPDIIPGG